MRVCPAPQTLYIHPLLWRAQAWHTHAHTLTHRHFHHAVKRLCWTVVSETWPLLMYYTNREEVILGNQKERRGADFSTGKNSSRIYRRKFESADVPWKLNGGSVDTERGQTVRRIDCSTSSPETVPIRPAAAGAACSRGVVQNTWQVQRSY